ncbi:uncharacterized protein LOC114579732 [Dendrobium catenatum]|uniref:uncharacterized protein LOC114579732 n=1 Tax=Dendrobium catenatum TaxID=906689 RepID=UPI0010A0902F|nr:uncharacterized protein LOC114579732 [Dendrobium catenatum]
MTSNDLHELGFVGPRLTWSNKKKGADQIMERLDRMLENSISVNYNQHLVVKHLPRIASDHCPMLLKISDYSSKGLKSFKFEDVWASYPASYAVVKNAWKRMDSGTAAEILNYKLKRSIKALFFWSKAKLKDLDYLKNLLKDKILKLQIKEAEDGGLFQEEYVLLKFKINELNATLACLNTWWRQRSKVKWIGEGDQNSKFFHSMASARKNINFIHCIKDSNGIIMEEQKQIEDVLIQFFKEKWRDLNCFLEGWPEVHQFLEEEDKRFLNNNFMIDEIKKAISETSRFTSPVYKIASKVILNRMKAIIPNIISVEQATFVKGRSPQDHVLIAQELFHKFRISNASKGLVSIKLDIEQLMILWDGQLFKSLLCNAVNLKWKERNELVHGKKERSSMFIAAEADSFL